jgi:hypothetical protein
MFDVKQKNLIKENKNTPANNLFIEEVYGETHKTTSTNGALKYSGLNDVLVEQFAAAAYYKKPRAFREIQKDALTLYGENSLAFVQFTLYLRLVSRKVKLLNGNSTQDVQVGQGLKHESICRMLWLHTYNPDVFWKNIGLFISAGSWRDIIQMLSYDLQYNGWEGRILNWKKFGDLILSGLNNPSQSELVKKYLPQIKANKACKTIESQADNLISKWVCSLLYGSKTDAGSTYKKYRKLKTSGTAHEWQKLISQRKFNEINFDRIAGRALNILVRSKFLDNSGLRAKYDAWVTAPTTKSVKYTGYVHELFANLPNSITGLKVAERETINKQFQTIVDLAKNNADSNVNRFIVVRDTSGSMTRTATGTNMTSYNIAKAMSLYFSEFLTGPFANTFIEFNSNAKLHNWVGNNPIEKWYNDKTSYVGSTNFLSVIDLLCSMKSKDISEDSFPSGILCISDMEFDTSQSRQNTNLQEAFKRMKAAGFSKEFLMDFKIVLWDIPNNFGTKKAPHFETYVSGIGGLYYFCGYDTSVISLLTKEKIKTARDLAVDAISQELMQLVEI